LLVLLPPPLSLSLTHTHSLSLTQQSGCYARTGALIRTGIDVEAGEYINVTLDMRAAKGVLSPKGKLYATQLGKGERQSSHKQHPWQ